MEQKAKEVVLRKEPYNKLIIVVSILIPLAIAMLFGVNIPGYDFSFLPPIYATINAVTAILLVTAVVAIKRKNRALHELLIKTCVVLSSSFLILYVLYHMTSDSTPYGGAGPLRYIYFIILITHILLSVGVIPMVLFTYLRAWRGDFSRHRAIAKYTFPLWLYVAVTGVIVYLMISPYYS